MSAAVQTKAPAKKKVTKPKVPAAHPKYADMVAAAIASLKERGGSSRQAILKYVVANYTVGTNTVVINRGIKTALKGGVTKGLLKQVKGTGAAGSFRLGEKVAKKPKVVQPKKVKTPKKATTTKPKAKKAAAKPKAAAAKPKAAVAKKVAKPKTKSPKKAKATAAKPKKAKTPKKKVAKKAPAKK